MQKKIRIGFTGDLSFSGYFRGMETEDILSPEVKAFVCENQYTVINLESPITEKSSTDKERLAHRCSPATTAFINKNFPRPVVSIANNHMMDYGKEGLIDTKKHLDDTHIPVIGTQSRKVFIIEEDGFKIGIFAVQYKDFKDQEAPLNELDRGLVKKTIKQLKAQADKVIVVYHGGEEFLHTPMPYNRKQLQRYIDWGADAVVGHHPHTVQGYEFYKGKYIFYSLGNFIFDTDYQRVQKDSEDGMLISLELSNDDSKVDFSYLPIRINRENHHIEARSEKDQYFRDIDHMDYDSFWPAEAVRKKSILADSNAVEPAKKVKRSKIDKLVDMVKEPAETKRKLTKKLYLRKGRKLYK